jgi:hypothetical protein
VSVFAAAGAVACALTGSVLALSVALKLRDRSQYAAWAASFDGTFLRLLLRHLVIPAEIALVAFLVWASMTPLAAVCACVVGAGLALMAWGWRWFGDAQPCACFGSLSVDGSVRTTTIFALLAAGDAALLLLGGNAHQPAGAVALASSWLLGAAVAAALVVFPRHRASKGMRSLPVFLPTHSTREIAVDALSRAGVTRSRQPVLAVISLRGCGPCRPLLASYLALAPELATVATCLLAVIGADTELPPGLRRWHGVDRAFAASIGALGFPSAVYFPAGLVGEEWSVLLGAEPIGEVIASLASTTPAKLATAGVGGATATA